jgi:hypothetical protein
MKRKNRGEKSCRDEMPAMQLIGQSGVASRKKILPVNPEISGPGD